MVEKKLPSGEQIKHVPEIHAYAGKHTDMQNHTISFWKSVYSDLQYIFHCSLHKNSSSDSSKIKFINTILYQ
jgi:hypothetical protein